MKDFKGLENQVLRDTVRKIICMHLCSYFKPSKNEELACIGFTVVERLLKKGEKIPFDEIRKKLDSTTKEKLISEMCIACPFYENDCDFVITPPSPPLGKVGKRAGRNARESPPPCGGFILLGLLLEKHIVSIDDIKNII